MTLTRQGLDVYRPGDYSATFSTQKSGGVKMIRTGEAAIQRILGGQFIQIDIDLAGGNPWRVKTLIYYDKESSKYHAWFFRNNGVVTTLESHPSEKVPRTTVFEGIDEGRKWRGTTEWSADYREIVETHRWYDQGGNLVRTDIGDLKLLTPQPDGAGNSHRAGQ